MKIHKENKCILREYYYDEIITHYLNKLLTSLVLADVNG